MQQQPHPYPFNEIDIIAGTNKDEAELILRAPYTTRGTILHLSSIAFYLLTGICIFSTILFFSLIHARPRLYPSFAPPSLEVLPFAPPEISATCSPANARSREGIFSCDALCLPSKCCHGTDVGCRHDYFEECASYVPHCDAAFRRSERYFRRGDVVQGLRAAPPPTVSIEECRDSRDVETNARCEGACRDASCCFGGKISKFGSSDDANLRSWQLHNRKVSCDDTEENARTCDIYKEICGAG